MNHKLLLLTLLAAASVQAAEVYKWTDANGVVHFSDSPPPADAKAEKVHVGGGVITTDQQPSNSETGENGSATPAPAPKQTAQAPASVEDTPENRAKLCAQAKANVELLASKYPVTAPAADGTQQSLDEKARQTRLAQEQQNADFLCKTQ